MSGARTERTRACSIEVIGFEAGASVCSRAHVVARALAPLGFAFCAWACSNGGSSSGGATHRDLELAVALDRQALDGPDAVVVTARATLGGTVLTDVVPTIWIAGSRQSVVEIEPGTFEARIVPRNERLEVPIVVEAEGVVVERVALVFTEVDDAWGQPEAVPGLVNTPGHEDSSEISPDGRWLIVSSYSPVDLVSCFTPPLDSTSSACNASRGPSAAPFRPNLPGAHRIVSPFEIDHTIPHLGMTTSNDPPWTGPLPPVSAFGFEREADGSFARPFVIAFDADGFSSGPFGMNFVAANGNSATLVYAWDDPSAGGQDADLHRTTIALGAPNVLGVLAGTFPVFVVDPPAERLPQASFDGSQSNPFVAGDGVFFDQHEPGLDEYDLWFMPGDWQSALGDPVRVATSQKGRSEFQPFEHGGRLYFAASDEVGDFKVLRSVERFTGSDPARTSSFGPERVELSLSSSRFDDELVSIGEPSLAIDRGRTRLYFVYGKRVEGGFDANIGRVVRREGR